MHTPSDKYQRVGAGEMMLPAYCAGCGTISSEEGFVDTKLDFEFYGIVYFCAGCVRNMSDVFEGSLYRKLESDLAVANNEILRLHGVNAGLEQQLDGIMVERLSARGYDVTGDLPSADVVEEPATESEDVDGIIAQFTEPEPEPAEPVKDDGDSDSDGTAISDKQPDPILGF